MVISNFRTLWNNLFFAVSLFIVGLIWAISSPISSAADDDYHLTSIWCNTGKAEFCKVVSTNEVFVPGKLNTGPIPEKFTGIPPCYVTWPYQNQSAECINEISDNFSYSNRLNTSLNSKIYYKTVGIFVTENTIKSVLSIRVFNLSIFIFLIFISLSINQINMQNSIKLVLGLATIPIALFFISSTNPISWAISGVISSFLILYKMIENFKYKINKNFKLIFIYLFSIIIAIGSRLDSIFYIFFTILFAIFGVYKDEISHYFNSKTKKIYFVFFLILSCFIYLFTKIILENLHKTNIEIFQKIEDSNSPNPIINIFIELPSFLVGLLGGQEPRYIQARGILGRDFTYGVGWLEFNFLSITGILLSLIISSLIFFNLKKDYLVTVLTINIFLTSIISLIILERANWNYLDGAYFQPRYLISYFIVFLISFLHCSNFKFINLSIVQKCIIFFAIFLAGYLAWRVLFVRYTAGLDYPVTNIQIKYEWFPYLVSNFNLISVFAHCLFYYNALFNINLFFTTKRARRDLNP